MNVIPEMKAVSIEEILAVLTECSEQLAHAYQESLVSDFWQASISADKARDYLLYVLHKQNNNATIH